MSTLVHYEPFVADTIATFLRVLDEKFVGKIGADGICDMSDWTKYFALDIVSALTMGVPYGLLKASRDHIGIIKARTGFLRYFTIVNNVTWLDKVLRKNPILMWLGRLGLYNAVTPTVPFARDQIATRLSISNPWMKLQSPKKLALTSSPNFYKRKLTILKLLTIELSLA
jgi:hypothetical protein